MGTRRGQATKMPNSLRADRGMGEGTRRVPLSCSGGSRQGRRADVGVLRLVVGEATGWSKVATMEVR